MKTPIACALSVLLGLLALQASAFADPAPSTPPQKTDAEKAADEKATSEKLAAKLPPGSKHYLDIPYVADAKPGISYESSQLLDLYVPPGAGPFPLLLSIHGGGWHAGGKGGGGYTALKAVPKGFALASIAYRWVQDAPFPAQIEDCNAALAFLRQHAAEYRLDPDHVGVMGHSAGAHLAALMATTGDGTTFSPDPALSRVQAAVCWAGPFDLDRERGEWPKTMFAWNPRDPFMKFFPGGGYDTAVAQKASPASYIHPGLPPFLIVHGGKDTTVPIGQAAAFAEKAKEAGADVTYEVDPDKDHNVGSDARTDEAIAFFQRVLQGKSTGN